ncbi:MAG: YbhB/YbcL family Raf kinase inhibitor-like protein [Isosphaeraceae bacterium]
MSRRFRMRLAGVVQGAWFLVLVGSPGCGGGAQAPDLDPSKQTIHLTSPAFADGAMIPKKYTCDGENHSPPLEWSYVPKTARALALICDDPDAPMGTWSHWVVFDLPPDTTKLEEGAGPDSAPLASHQGKNDFAKIGYGGPCPPSGTHRYFFRLYALDQQLNLGSSATRAMVLKAIKGHILAEGRLMGKYARS